MGQIYNFPIFLVCMFLDMIFSKISNNTHMECYILAIDEYLPVLRVIPHIGSK